jgi:predicted ester cyclase
MGDQIVAGTVLQFDEYFNYPGWREGEWKAFEEFCEARHAEIEYIGYVADGEQVAVRVSKIAPVENRPNPGA